MKSAQARGRAAKNKGKVGEREAAVILQEVLRLEVGALRRSVQYCGRAGTADIVGIEGIHIECKRCEKLSVYSAIEQAQRDSQGNVPIVMHRRNNKGWLLIVEVENLLELAKLVIRKSGTKRRTLA